MLRCHQLNSELGLDYKEWPDAERITLSSLKNWEAKDHQAGTFSIKYVLEGTEHYFIHGKKFSVSRGQYLIVNARQNVDILIDSRKEVKCFCIHMTTSWMDEVHTGASRNLDKQLDNPWKGPAAGEFEEL